MQGKKQGMDPDAVLATLQQMTRTIQTLSGTIARLEKYVQSHAVQQAQIADVASGAAADGKKLLH